MTSCRCRDDKLTSDRVRPMELGVIDIALPWNSAVPSLPVVEVGDLGGGEVQPLAGPQVGVWSRRNC